MHRSRVHTPLAILALLALLAACGSDDPAATDPPAEADPVDEPAPADDPAPADGPDGDATVAVAATDLGEVLVDGDGMTLYVFDPDEQGPSTCVDACATSWPPLIDDAPVAGDGIDAALLGTSTRDDGSEQVTYDGWPLYLWAADSAPGDTTGQAVQDVWWVITADGTVIRGDNPSSEPDSAPSGGSPRDEYGY